MKRRIEIGGRSFPLPVVILSITFFLYLLIPRPDLFEGVSTSNAYYDQKGKLLRLTTTRDEKFRLHTGLKQISPKLIEATLLYEDQYFYYHPGFNPVSLLKAFWKSYIVKSRRMGASTITMQLARLRYGLETSGLWGKFFQIVKAIQLERHYSKKEILEAYLTLAPYGQNIEGVAAASLIYFGKRPERLTLQESLALSVIPQNPVKNALTRKTQEDAPEALSEIVKLWINEHPEEAPQKEFLLSPFVVKERTELPFLAPHLTESLEQDRYKKGETYTTIEWESQELVESMLKEYVKRRASQGIYNAAALLVDSRTMEVKAIAGSSDFFNKEIEGQVDGTRAPRSPGSTLKPFVYALALEQGLIHPMTILKDAPMGFGDYIPENIDGKFQGPITAQTALTRSRNIPAAYLATRLENPDLYELLVKAEVKDLKERNYYGLALVLGALEISMRELAELYGALANGGKWRPLRLLSQRPGENISQNENSTRERTLFSREAAHITVSMLQKNPAPRGYGALKYGMGSLPVAWKSGTSYGYKDGWAIGLFGPYVLAVWVGNFDGEGNPAFIGRYGAAPLFFQIKEALEKQFYPLEVPEVPLDINVATVEICAASGGLPGPHCPVKNKALFIPGKSPIAPDTIYRLIYVRPGGFRACHPGESGSRAQVYEFWPGDLLRLFREAGIPRRTPPPFGPDCTETQVGLNPEITSPRPGVVYKLQENRPTIPFSAVADADAFALYWFVDTAYVGQSAATEAFFWEARPGKYIVRVVDNMGRYAARGIEISPSVFPAE